MSRSRHILRHRARFKRMFEEGQWVRTSFFKFLHRRNDRGYCRVGIMVGKRFGKAVVRNRAKRVFREVTRHGRLTLAEGRDIVIFPRRGMENVPFLTIKTAWESALREQGLVTPSPA